VITSPGYNHSVPDRLYFSCRIKGASPAGLLRQFGEMLNVFPFSNLAKRGPVLRVYAIQHVEPALAEREFPVSSDTAGTTAQMLEAAGELLYSDCACEIDTFWDLWQYHGGEWKLRPAAVTLACYGVDFENQPQDHLRIEFGPDGRFLPVPGLEGSLRLSQSNLKSLLHLVSDLERVLDLETRQVWSESGANFADVLKQALGTYHVN
jgi:hypothetical protein